MAQNVWKGVFQIDEQPPPHTLDTFCFATDAILVRSIPDGLTIPSDIGKQLQQNRFLFGPFLKESLEKCATTIALLYSGTGASPKLVTEAKKFAIRTVKLGGDDKAAVQTQRFVDSLQTAAQVVASDSALIQAAIAAFSNFQTIATFKKRAGEILKEKYIVFQPIIDVIDALAMPQNVKLRDMIGVDKGYVANIYRFVTLGMLYLLDGDITNAQLNNNFAYAASVYWAQLFLSAKPPPAPAPAKKK